MASFTEFVSRRRSVQPMVEEALTGAVRGNPGGLPSFVPFDEAVALAKCMVMDFDAPGSSEVSEQLYERAQLRFDTSFKIQAADYSADEARRMYFGVSERIDQMFGCDTPIVTCVERQLEIFAKAAAEEAAAKAEEVSDHSDTPYTSDVGDDLDRVLGSVIEGERSVDYRYLAFVQPAHEAGAALLLGPAPSLRAVFSQPADWFRSVVDPIYDVPCFGDGSGGWQIGASGELSLGSLLAKAAVDSGYDSSTFGWRCRGLLQAGRFSQNVRVDRDSVLGAVVTSDACEDGHDDAFVGLSDGYCYCDLADTPEQAEKLRSKLGKFPGALAICRVLYELCGHKALNSPALAEYAPGRFHVVNRSVRASGSGGGLLSIADVAKRCPKAPVGGASSLDLLGVRNWVGSVLRHMRIGQDSVEVVITNAAVFAQAKASCVGVVVTPEGSPAVVSGRNITTGSVRSVVIDVLPDGASFGHGMASLLPDDLWFGAPQALWFFSGFPLTVLRAAGARGTSVNGCQPVQLSGAEPSRREVFDTGTFVLRSRGFGVCRLSSPDGRGTVGSVLVPPDGLAYLVGGYVDVATIRSVGDGSDGLVCVTVTAFE